MIRFLLRHHPANHRRRKHLQMIRFSPETSSGKPPEEKACSNDPYYFVVFDCFKSGGGGIQADVLGCGAWAAWGAWGAEIR